MQVVWEQIGGSSNMGVATRRPAARVRLATTRTLRCGLGTALEVPLLTKQTKQVLHQIGVSFVLIFLKCSNVQHEAPGLRQRLCQCC